MKERRWEVQTKVEEGTLKKREIIKLLLRNRGQKSEADTREFLNPKDPRKLGVAELGIREQDLQEGVERILKAIRNKEKIVVYGDYDADGICATAIVWEAINALGGDIMPYIPSRSKEGYGLSIKGIDKCIKDLDPKLIITVDHGIVAAKQVDYAQSKGIDVVITDHHLAQEEKPKAFSTIHTTLLSGSGIAWVLVNNLEEQAKAQKEPALKVRSLLELAAIGSIADLIPLNGANRSIVRYGLEELNNTRRPGLIALIKDAGLKMGEIGTYEIGFIIAPRLNAVGRLEHALDSLRLLCTKSGKRAEELALKLGLTNRERQKLTDETTIHAKNQASEKLTKNGPGLIFVAHESYNQGIIGLVAGKLVEEFYYPTVVIAIGETVSKASARSIEGFNVVEVIRECKDILVDVGGHPMAAGFTVETDKLALLEERLGNIAQEKLNPEILTKRIKVDCEIDFSSINLDLYTGIRELEPFGIGNPEPVFLSRDCLLTSFQVVGNEGKHLRMWLTQGPKASPVDMEAIAFNQGALAKTLKPGTKIDVVYSLTLDNWNGQQKIKLRVRDTKLKN